jgi:hypothetical protein
LSLSRGRKISPKKSRKLISPITDRSNVISHNKWRAIFHAILAHGAPESCGYLLHINSFDGFIFLILVVAGSLPMRVKYMASQQTFLCCPPCVPHRTAAGLYGWAGSNSPYQARLCRSHEEAPASRAATILSGSMKTPSGRRANSGEFWMCSIDVQLSP